jgi:hypothetical protein
MVLRASCAPRNFRISIITVTDAKRYYQKTSTFANNVTRKSYSWWPFKCTQTIQRGTPLSIILVRHHLHVADSIIVEYTLNPGIAAVAAPSLGNFTYDRSSRCPCKNGPVCRFCNYCSGCSCRCHSWFTLHSRLFGSGEGEELLNRVETAVSSANCEPNKYLDDPQHLENRLEVAERLFH